MISTILAPIFVFAVIVFIHEGGHFLMAKATGMRVIEFAIGFGPKLVSKKWGETTYSIRIIPLGGYNKIAGMDDENKDDPRAFSQKPVWARLLVIIGGALFNVLLALVIFISVYKIVGYQTFPNLPIVGSVLEGTTAAQHGLQAGDTIISINGKAVAKWEDIGQELKDKANRVIPIEISRDGEKKQMDIIPQDNGEGRAIMGITPYVEHHDTTLTQAISMGFERCVFLLKMMVGGLYGMITGGPADVAGPIGVARMSSAVADTGLMPLFLFIALLSLNLGFLNLLPIPLLDGGLLILTIIEGIIGRELPRKALVYIQAVGIAILGTLFLYAMGNDISMLLK